MWAEGEVLEVEETAEGACGRYVWRETLIECVVEVTNLSKANRNKIGKDRYYQPSQKSCILDYLTRRNRVVARVDQLYNCHVHIQRICRFGLRDELVLDIAARKNDHTTRLRQHEIREILDMSRSEFRELATVTVR